MPSYKSFCWALGTTSFRMVEFNRKIEEQLKLVVEFWSLPDNNGKEWNNDIQEKYYDFIREKGFIEDLDANRKDKDAREKTSGLVDLGLLNDDRSITETGNALLTIANSGNFESDNILRLHTDSFIYLKQLLKTSVSFDNGVVRPYLILAYLLTQLGEITKDEFTYLLPLITNKDKAIKVVKEIKDIRNGVRTIDDAIIDVLFDMDNYKEAKNIFMNASQITEQVIMNVGMNRKSHLYDKPLLKIYENLYKVWQTKNDDYVSSFLASILALTGKASSLWKQYIFNTPLSSKIKKYGIATVDLNNKLFKCNNETEFKDCFFNLMHLFKAKSLLSDYLDLNRRYFKTSDTILFQDDKVKFDIIPNCFFSIAKDKLFDLAFETTDLLVKNCELKDIDNCFDINENQIFNKVEELYGVQVRSIYDIENFVDKERYERFNRMIDEKFTDDTIIDLMGKFESRNDSEIQSIVTNNADVPTIFEYVLAIAWYKISGRQGKILDYMNLTLDADLLPITHAAGGQGDIEYQYSATETYPAHTLLIEATLANKTNQRRMEMEPVSRHLGDYLLDNKDKEAYCVFATTYLHIQVISDFRARKNMQYYSSDGNESIDGMKIIPFETNEIKTIIKKQITYAQLYPLFEKAYNSTLNPKEWYNEEIKNKI